jgi:class 3 adenylate cyclase
MIDSAACGSGSAALATQLIERRLAAILAADIAGYSRLMGADEEGTLAQVKAHRQELIDPKTSEHRGRIVKTTGDGILIEFPSVIELARPGACHRRQLDEQPESTLPLRHRPADYPTTAGFGCSRGVRFSIAPRTSASA